ncbi:hypothetical protein [Psychromonas sp. KJ10-2]|uniref:hypothetical protein n=1 Tax=Psychromonas sp. KJ10-2 TaxID=3391822 RepID=UPI0039B6305F
MVKCNEAAEYMLTSGEYFTAAKLGKELNVTAMVATGFIYNIRNAKKYETIETSLPNRKVKVLSIKGRSIGINELWGLVL